MSSKWNARNPAIRRIQADVRELARAPSSQYFAVPNEENIFEWDFVVRGPPDSDFERGLYHGRILLPAEYPFKSPNIVFLTPNGRWEVKQKICLSISAHHPETWQPSWGIRTILEALVSFMPTPADGAVGALDASPAVRRRLAIESNTYTHPAMPEIPQIEEGDPPAEDREEIAARVQQMHVRSLGSAPPGPVPEEEKACVKEEELEEEEEDEEAKTRGDEQGESLESSPTVEEEPRREVILRMSQHVLSFVLFVLLYRRVLNVYVDV